MSTPDRRNERNIPREIQTSKLIPFSSIASTIIRLHVHMSCNLTGVWRPSLRSCTDDCARMLPHMYPVGTRCSTSGTPPRALVPCPKLLLPSVIRMSDAGSSRLRRSSAGRDLPRDSERGSGISRVARRRPNLISNTRWATGVRDYQGRGDNETVRGRRGFNATHLSLPEPELRDAVCCHTEDHLHKHFFHVV